MPIDFGGLGDDLEEALTNISKTVNNVVSAAGAMSEAALASDGPNYTASNLTDPKYNYDLVVATTAKSINNTIKMYLARYANEPTIVWYGQEDAGEPVVPMEPIPGIDPFAIPDGEEPPDELLDSPFAFAIKAGFGLPPGVALDSIPDILLLGSDRQKVTYNLFFHTFEIVELDWGRRGSHSWTHHTQPSGNPYLFQFQVDMNFDAADPDAKFADLPPEAQQRLKNLHTSTMFSVQQLYLDLNSAGLQNMPTIQGVPDDSPLYDTLHRDFINTYWKQISGDGKFVLGYTATANTPPADAKRDVQPTALNFSVSPYYDAQGNPTTVHGLYTLDYLMTTENRPLQVGAPFNWNWVSQSEASADGGSVHGAMAVRRAIFAEFLNKSLSSKLGMVCNQPYVYIHVHGVMANVDKKCQLQKVPTTFTYQADSGSKILTLNYNSTVDKDQKVQGTNFHLGRDESTSWVGSMPGMGKAVKAHYTVKSAASGNVQLSGNEITVTMNGSLWMDYDGPDLSSVDMVRGTAGSFSATAIYVIGVDASGKLTVAHKPGYPQTKIGGSDIDQHFMAGIDGATGAADKAKEAYKNVISAIQSFPDEVKNYLNSTANQWVFPGGQTFLFKDAVFSNSQDLIAHITYANPNQ